MVKIKYLAGFILAVLASVWIGSLIQANIIASAAETITGNSNEIITINTTDGLAVNSPLNIYGYSDDGNFVLFTSNATNLSDANSFTGLYTYNIKENSTKRVDTSSSGIVGNASVFPSNTKAHIISENGRYINFMSNATNLIDGSTLSGTNLYQKDMQTGTTTRITSLASSAGASTKWEYNIGLSNDGRFTLLSSRYLSNTYPYSFGYVLRDSTANTWTRFATGNETESSNSAKNVRGDLSCDGAFAAYQDASFVKLIDFRRGIDTVIATASTHSISPLISCNGRFMLYATTDRSQITPTPSGMNTYLHLVRYDRLTNQRQYIDSNSAGVFDNRTLDPYSSTNPVANIFNASIADSGDVVFKYKDYSYLKHLSDGSGTLEPVAKNTAGSPVNIAYATLTRNGKFIFFNADPYSLGLSASPSSLQLIRTKTNL